MHPIDLKLERIRRGIPQYRFAAMLGIPPTTLSKIENGQQRISREHLAAMAAKLNEVASPARGRDDLVGGAS